MLKKRSSIIAILIFSLCVASCERDSKENNIIKSEGQRLINIYTKYYNLDSTASAFSNFGYIENGYYYTLNRNSNSIIVYQENSPAIVDRIHLPSDGPNEISVASFHIQGDSIFVTANESNEIALFIADTLKFRRSLFRTESMNNVRAFTYGYGSRTNYSKGCYWFPILSDYSKSDSPNLAKYTVEKDSFEVCISYPGDYDLSGSIYSRLSSIDFVDERIYVSFPKSEDVFVYKSEDYVEQIQISSSFQKNLIGDRRASENEVSQAISYYTEEEYYGPLHCDGNFIYRVFSRPKEIIINNETRLIPEKYLIVYSVAEKRVVVESRLPRGSNPINSMVGRDGLYIMKISKRDSENKVRYDVYRLGEKNDEIVKKLSAQLELDDDQRVFIISGQSCKACIEDFTSKPIVFASNDIVVLADFDNKDSFYDDIVTRLRSKVTVKEMGTINLLGSYPNLGSTPVVINPEKNEMAYLY
jgi:hypothetical protein